MNSFPILIGYSGGLFSKGNGVGADRAQNDWQFIGIKSHNYLKFARRTISPKRWVVVQLCETNPRTLSFRSQVYRRGICLLPAAEQLIPRAKMPRIGMTIPWG